MDPILTVSELIAHEGPVAIVDARRSRERFLASHLAGARWVDLDHDLAAPVTDASRGGRHPLPTPEAFARTLSRLGITPAHLVVAYDDQGGALAAARLWWMLRAYGHTAVRVLDGGLAAIEEAAREGTLALATGPVEDAWDGQGEPPYPVGAFAGDVADLDAVERLRSDPRWLVVDARSAERFAGRNETIDPVAGHVPGAVNVPYATNLDARGRFLDAALLRAKYEAVLDGRPVEQLILQCGSGVTACHSLLALHRAGLDGARLWVGSWSEWCRRPELPR